VPADKGADAPPLNNDGLRSPTVGAHRRARRKVGLFALVVALLLASGIAVWWVVRPGPLLKDDFGGPDRLVSNEFAYWNPNAPGAVVSRRWVLTSGSLFVRHGVAWTGWPDHAAPDPTSSRHTNSAIFRLYTQKQDFGDVSVAFRLRNLGLVTTPTTPAEQWDGVHVWLRYQDEYSLYYASVNRRDNTVVIKKKVPGGPSNNGTYFELGSGHLTVSYERWQQIRASARNNADGSVTISFSVDGRQVLTATDRGIGGPPISRPGAIGIRGDNCNFEFDHLVVDSL
jgi:hypothetical protein